MKEHTIKRVPLHRADCIRGVTAPNGGIMNDATGKSMLIELAHENGREVAFLSNGYIWTFDRYDGCDRFTSADINTVYEWELGYKR